MRDSWALRLADETGAIRFGRWINPALNQVTTDAGGALERDRTLRLLESGLSRRTGWPPAPQAASPIARLEGSGRTWVESNWGDIHYRFVSSGNGPHGGPGGITRYYRNNYQPYDQWTPEMRRTLMQEIQWSPELAEKFPNLWFMRTG